MTLETLYAHMDADYSESLRRIGGDERIVKYLRIMRRDPSFDALREAVESQDYRTAFRAAHTIKGASLNLGLTKLVDCSSKLTEALRPQEPNEAVAPLFKETERVYQEAITCIDALLDDTEER
ncbi:Hpt domain-containing protein [Paraeggerthella hongkongensis]|uniref:Histidine kinase n=1 Tax=Paraeggerthella hongkongensis TaxID=230658 RepID=A0A3N0BIT2_9ACTN|nr:Hpt domain-containing protein [Paraeggerthella hongkongensis]RNL48129.1 histidine kinase [Paraeggerthella hongkongensis]